MLSLIIFCFVFGLEGIWRLGIRKETLWEGAHKGREAKQNNNKTKVEKQEQAIRNV